MDGWMIFIFYLHICYEYLNYDRSYLSVTGHTHSLSLGAIYHTVLTTTTLARCLVVVFVFLLPGGTLRICCEVSATRKTLCAVRIFRT